MRNVGDFHPLKGIIIENLRNFEDFHPLQWKYNRKTSKRWGFPSLGKRILLENFEPVENFHPV